MAGGSDVEEMKHPAAAANRAKLSHASYEEDRLMMTAPSPVVALNRAIAIAQHDGAERGMEALLAIEDRDRL